MEYDEVANWIDDDSEYYVEPDFYGEFDEELLEDPEDLAVTLTEVLHEDHSAASPEQLQDVLLGLTATMTPAEAFSFKKALRAIKKIGRNPIVGQISQTALPIAGGALGTLVGGPVGTALGTKLGQAAGAQLGQRKKKPRRPPKREKSPRAGSTAAAQLLQLTQNPNLLKSLLALSLGANGRKSIPVAAGKSVPAGAFMNLLGTLAAQAAADADELRREQADSESYSMDGDGEFRVDASVPEHRADVLYQLLSDSEHQRLDADAESYLDLLEYENELGY